MPPLPSTGPSVSGWLRRLEKGGGGVWLRQPLLAKCKDTASGGIGCASVAKKAYFPDRAVLYQAPRADGKRVLAVQARGLVSCPNQGRGEGITADPPIPSVLLPPKPRAAQTQSLTLLQRLARLPCPAERGEGRASLTSPVPAYYEKYFVFVHACAHMPMASRWIPLQCCMTKETEEEQWRRRKRARRREHEGHQPVRSAARPTARAKLRNQRVSVPRAVVQDWQLGPSYWQIDLSLSTCTAPLDPIPLPWGSASGGHTRRRRPLLSIRSDLQCLSDIWPCLSGGVGSTRAGMQSLYMDTRSGPGGGAWTRCLAGSRPGRAPNEPAIHVLAAVVEGG